MGIRVLYGTVAHLTLETFAFVQKLCTGTVTGTFSFLGFVHLKKCFESDEEHYTRFAGRSLLWLQTCRCWGQLPFCDLFFEVSFIIISLAVLWRRLSGKPRLRLSRRIRTSGWVQAIWTEHSSVLGHFYKVWPATRLRKGQIPRCEWKHPRRRSHLKFVCQFPWFQDMPRTYHMHLHTHWSLTFVWEKVFLKSFVPFEPFVDCCRL